ncbi:DUF4372 domain-containing protein [Planctomycetota bacterium]
MNSGQMVFSQLMDCLPWWRFHPIVKQYQGNHKVKHFSCAETLRDYSGIGNSVWDVGA